MKEEYIELYKMELRKLYAALNEERAVNIDHYKSKITGVDFDAMPGIISNSKDCCLLLNASPFEVESYFHFRRVIDTKVTSRL